MNKQHFYKTKIPTFDRTIINTTQLNTQIKKEENINTPRIYKYKTYLRGLQFTIKGRLKGARRARTMVERYGTIGPNTYRKQSFSNQKIIFTKWGTWSLTTSLYRNNDQKL